MSKKPQVYHDGGITFEWITERAKEIILEEGEFPPVLFVEWDGNKVIGLGVPQLEDDVTSRQRALMLFLAGRHFAQKFWKNHKKHKVTSVYQVNEGWAAPPGPLRPSENPNRTEVLQIVKIDPATKKQYLRAFEMLRDRGGKLTDLLDKTGEDWELWETYGPGLPAFLAGVATANQHESDARHALRRILEEHVTRFRDRMEEYNRERGEE
jgi:hypothetical protein